MKKTIKKIWGMKGKSGILLSLAGVVILAILNMTLFGKLMIIFSSIATIFISINIYIKLIEIIEGDDDKKSPNGENFVAKWAGRLEEQENTLNKDVYEAQDELAAVESELSLLKIKLEKSENENKALKVLFKEINDETPEPTKTKAEKPAEAPKKAETEKTVESPKKDTEQTGTESEWLKELQRKRYTK